jgi:uncharacterized RDD family membrane protein YckC/Tfp pilus assembly major pilin PilA
MMKCLQCGAELAPEAQYCSKCGASTSASGGYGVSAASQAAQPASVDMTGVYAGFWRRFAAFIIDSIVIYAVAFAAALGLAFGGAGDPGSMMLLNLGFLVLAWLYYALQESSEAQATLGKRALGIKVTDERCERISFGRATGRHFAKIISSLVFGVGYLMAAFTQRKQGLHDMIASTLVVLRSADAEAMQSGRVEQRGGAGVVAAIVIAAFAFIFVIGILAAIAIPAYQDYTVRAQVTEGLTLSAPLKEAIAEWSAENERLPQDLDEIGYDGDLQGQFVQSVDVRDGVIVIVYGGAAHRLIQEQSLALAPDVDADGVINWECGLADATTVPNKYLPSACRR